MQSVPAEELRRLEKELAAAERIGGRWCRKANVARDALKEANAVNAAHARQIAAVERKLGRDEAHRLSALCARALLDVGVRPEDVEAAGYPESVVAAFRRWVGPYFNELRARRLDRESVTGGRLTGVELARAWREAREKL